MTDKATDLRVGNDQCSKCLAIHPATFDCQSTIAIRAAYEPAGDVGDIVTGLDEIAKYLDGSQTPNSGNAVRQAADHLTRLSAENEALKAKLDTDCFALGEEIEALRAQLAAERGRADGLEKHIREQIEHVETRIQDGKDMGATVWRIALEDVSSENRQALTAHKENRDGQ